MTISYIHVFMKKIQREEVLSPEEKAIALPSREVFAHVFRFLRANKGWHGNKEMLYLRLHNDICNACNIRIAFDVLLELGVILKEEDAVTLGNGEKVNLEDSVILQKLQ